MSRATAPKPFWQQSKPPQKLSGTWPALVAAAGEQLILKYDRGATYELGALIDHPQLGVGVVIELPAPGKVLVRFADGDKILICGRA